MSNHRPSPSPCGVVHRANANCGTTRPTATSGQRLAKIAPRVRAAMIIRGKYHPEICDGFG